MERLTKKYDENDYNSIWGYGNFIESQEEQDKLFNKLGKLEDIEEELGIPLEVLFKALKDGIWTKDRYIDYVYLDYALLERTYWLITADDVVINLKYYGKTWWLEKPNEKVSD